MVTGDEVHDGPRVSVVVTTCADTPLLRNCLARTLAQAPVASGEVLVAFHVGEHEVAVVDGGSRDATAEIAASKPRVRLYRRPCEEDLGGQKNFALDQCFGEWILMLDADDLLGGWGCRHLRAPTRLPKLRWFSFSRFWLVEQDGRIGYLAAKPYYRDRQIRLFRNEPGFRYDSSRQPIHHPLVAKHGVGITLRGPHIYHYALLLQDRATREAKYERYMRAEPASERLDQMGLWEESGVPVRSLPIACGSTGASFAQRTKGYDLQGVEVCHAGSLLRSRPPARCHPRPPGLRKWHRPQRDDPRARHVPPAGRSSRRASRAAAGRRWRSGSARPVRRRARTISRGGSRRTHSSSRRRSASWPSRTTGPR